MCSLYRAFKSPWVTNKPTSNRVKHYFGPTEVATYSFDCGAIETGINTVRLTIESAQGYTVLSNERDPLFFRLGRGVSLVTMFCY